jgi:hypothetical protein
MHRSLVAFVSLVPALAFAQPQAPAKPGSVVGGTANGGDLSCGRMLERRSVLPIKLEQLLSATADSYDAHAKWVGTKDKAARAESDLLNDLAKNDRELAEKFRRHSNMMSKGRDLGMTPHDMTSPFAARSMEADARMVRAQREFAQALMQDADELEARLRRMKEGSGGN